MQSQNQNDPGSSFQDIALASSLTLVSSSLLVSYLRSKKIRSKLRKYAPRSNSIQPEVSYVGTSFIARIPKNTTRKTLYGYGPQTRVSEIEILLVNRGNEEGDKDDRRQFTLTKEHPKQNLSIIPKKDYGYIFRTREDDLDWGEWSEFVDFISEPIPFRILPGMPSRERCSEIIEMIKQGVPFNILVVGKPGAGKSALINRLKMAVEGDWACCTITKRGGETTTQKMTENQLIPGFVSIYDMPGWEDNFTLELLPLILKGEYDKVTPKGLKAKTPVKNDAINAQQRTPEKPLPKIDVVLFVMAEDTLDVDSGLHEQLLGVLNQSSTPRLGILTKVDEIGKRDGWPVSSERFYEDKRVIDQCKKVPSLDHVFPLANPPTYTPAVEVDELMLQMLRTAQEIAKADSSKLE